MAPAARAVLSALCLSFIGCDGEAPPPVMDDDALSPAHCQYEKAEAQPAIGKPQAAPLRAGVGEAPLDMPVGTPLGAYTARWTLLGGHGPDARRSPYARAFAPSAGVQTRPLARALYLEAGPSKLVLVKADLGVAFDRLVYDLEQALAPDGSLRGRVIIGTSHSHSTWATFQGVYHLSLGFDVFMEPQYQRLLASLVRAAKAAMTQAVPARLGAGVWDGWDPKDEIFSDRRGEDDKLPGPDGKPVGPHKDDRLLVLRVDDMQEQPLAVLFNFPMHGTIGGEDNPLASVDAPGHVELLLEERFERPVLAMHLQGPAGDSSPRGRGGIGLCDSDAKKMLCANFARMESVGEIAAPRIYELWSALQTAPQVALDVLSRAIPNGRAISVRGGMAYAPYQEDVPVDTSPEAIYTPDGQVRTPITQFNVPSGAGLCGSKNSMLPIAAGIEGATDAPYSSCAEIGSASMFIASILKTPVPAIPDCPTTRTTMTALRLGGVPVVVRTIEGGGPPVYKQRQDDLLLVTMPGEPLSLLADALRAKSPAGPDRTFVIGYAQGHIGYILGVENWLLGGYEPSINIYGPIEGEYLMERALDLGRALWNGEALPAEDRGRLVFTPGTAAAPPVSKADGAGTVPDMVPAEVVLRSRELPAEAQPLQTVERVTGRATFLFYGGDPGEDTPVVTLEREDQPAQWQAVKRRSGRVLDNRGREMILTYTPLPVTGDPQHHLWAVEWQAVGWDRGADSVGIAGALSAPLGRYRFAVRGTAGGKGYALASRPFTLKKGTLKVDAAVDGAKVTGHAAYPVGAGYRLLRLDGISDGDVPVAGMIVVRVQSKKDMTSQELTVPAAPDGGFTVQTTGLDLSMGATVTVRDAAGNEGSH